MTMIMITLVTTVMVKGFRVEFMAVIKSEIRLEIELESIT